MQIVKFEIKSLKGLKIGCIIAGTVINSFDLVVAIQSVAQTGQIGTIGRRTIES